MANYCCLPMSANVLNNKKVIVMMAFIVTLTCFKNTIKKPSLFIRQNHGNPSREQCTADEGSRIHT